MDIQSPTFSTRDYSEASTLFASGLRLVNVRKNGDIWFEFEPGERAQKLIRDLWSGDLQMPLRIFIQGQQTAKRLIRKADDHSHEAFDAFLPAAR